MYRNPGLKLQGASNVDWFYEFNLGRKAVCNVSRALLLKTIEIVYHQWQFGPLF